MLLDRDLFDDGTEEELQATDSAGNVQDNQCPPGISDSKQEYNKLRDDEPVESGQQKTSAVEDEQNRSAVEINQGTYRCAPFISY